MSAVQLHLLINHAPLFAAVAGLALLAAGLGRRSGELTAAALLTPPLAALLGGVSFLSRGAPRARTRAPPPPRPGYPRATRGGRGPRAPPRSPRGSLAGRAPACSRSRAPGAAPRAAGGRRRPL